MKFILKEVVIMSINEAVKNYLEENPKTNKQTFIKMMGDIFANVEKKGKNKKGEAVEKPEKKLNAYQVFMKEQMPLLQKRENEKGKGEAKKKPKELMSEISEMWKMQK